MAIRFANSRKGFSVLLALLGCGVLAACKPQAPSIACPRPPVADGFMILPAEGGKMLLKLPVSRAEPHDYTLDCKQLRNLSLDFIWYRGELLTGVEYRAKTPPGETPWVAGYDMMVMVYTRFESLEEARLSREGLEFVGSPVPHDRYPLALYPRVERKATQRASADLSLWKYWAVRGTHDPVSGQPFLAYCDISPSDKSRPETKVTGDFPPGYPDARCRIGFKAVKGNNVIAADIHIWAKNAPFADQISNAVAAELESYIASP